MIYIFPNKIRYLASSIYTLSTSELILQAIDKNIVSIGRANCRHHEIILISCGIVYAVSKFKLVRDQWQTMFHKRSAPKMVGTACELVDLGPVAVIIWKKYYDANNDLHRKILLMLEGSAHLDEILETHATRFALPTDAARDLVATARVYLSVWTEVASHFKDLELPLYSQTSKAHFLFHSCKQAQFHRDAAASNSSLE